MKLTHEYNEYVVGLIVTDTDTQRDVNFQYEQVESNHPTPAYALTWGCEGDDTYRAFTEEELEVISDYVAALDNSETLENEITAIMHSAVKYEMNDFQAKQGCLTQSDIVCFYRSTSEGQEALEDALKVRLNAWFDGFKQDPCVGFGANTYAEVKAQVFDDLVGQFMRDTWGPEWEGDAQAQEFYELKACDLRGNAENDMQDWIDENGEFGEDQAQD